MMEINGITAVILAGGASTRMGADKATMKLPGGQLMIEVVAEALRAHCRQLIVAGASSGLAGARHLTDLRPGRGPLAGIETALASGIDETYLFCPCDVPRLTADMLEPLVTAPPETVAVVLRPSGADRFLPLPARLSVAALPAVQEALNAGEGAVHKVIQRLGPHVVRVPEEWSDALRGANTPQEL